MQRTLYPVIGLDEGSGAGPAVLESHRKYIDVQFVIEGTDMIGWRPVYKATRTHPWGERDGSTGR